MGNICQTSQSDPTVYKPGDRPITSAIGIP